MNNNNNNWGANNNSNNNGVNNTNNNNGDNNNNSNNNNNSPFPQPPTLNGNKEDDNKNNNNNNQNQHENQNQNEQHLYTPQQNSISPNMMPPSPANTTSYQPARVMSQQIGQRFSQYSLSSLAMRKKRQLNVTPSPNQVFQGSGIVGPEQATTLYYSLPFISTLPETQMVYR